MMDPVKWLMQERKSHQSARPALCDDASGGRIHGASSQADLFDVFAPALEIGRKEGGNEVHPNEIFPQIEHRHGHQDSDSYGCGEGQLSPDALANPFVSN